MSENDIATLEHVLAANFQGEHGGWLRFVRNDWGHGLACTVFDIPREHVAAILKWNVCKEDKTA